MALDLYEQTDIGTYTALSTDSDMTNPLVTLHNGRNGTTEEKKLYVSSDDAHTYTNIQVKSNVTDSSLDLDPTVVGASGWGVKLLVDTGTDPTENDWAAVDYNNTIDIDDISSKATYRAIWVRIESPAGIRPKNKRNIVLDIMYTDTP